MTWIRGYLLVTVISTMEQRFLWPWPYKGGSQIWAEGFPSSWTMNGIQVGYLRIPLLCQPLEEKLGPKGQRGYVSFCGCWMEARLITNIKKTKAKEMEQTLKFLDGPETDCIQQKHPWEQRKVVLAMALYERVAPWLSTPTVLRKHFVWQKIPNQNTCRGQCVLFRKTIYFPKRRERISNNHYFLTPAGCSCVWGWGVCFFLFFLLSAFQPELWFVQGGEQYGEANELVFIVCS